MIRTIMHTYLAQLAKSTRADAVKVYYAREADRAPELLGNTPFLVTVAYATYRRLALRCYLLGVLAGMLVMGSVLTAIYIGVGGAP